MDFINPDDVLFFNGFLGKDSAFQKGMRFFVHWAQFVTVICLFKMSKGFMAAV